MKKHGEYFTIEQYAKIKGIDLDQLAAERGMTRAELIKEFELKASERCKTTGSNWFELYQN